MRTIGYLAVAALCATVPALHAKGVFALGETESSLMMPEGASFEIGADGNFLVGGKPRFLIGNLYYVHYGSDSLVHGPGYPDEYWLS